MAEIGAGALKAVLYAAKSTEDVHGSIPTQLTDARAMAEREGWEIVGEYEDEAKSAYSGSRGDGLTRAKAQAERLVAEGHAAVLVVQHSDRLARGDGGREAAHLVEFSLWRAKSGVAIRSVQDDATWTTPMGHLIPALMGERNYEDSRRKGLAVQAGMRREAAKGRFVGGRVPYGYLGVGKGADRKLEEAPAQADVVRSIFTDYVAGVSAREITRGLTVAGTPSPTGGVWQRSAVARILANVTYLGRVRAPDGELLPGHPAIVEEGMWQRAQAIRAGHLKRKPGRHPDGGHLLVKGLLRCHCGAAMKPMRVRPNIRRSVYRCSGRIEHGADFCSQPGVHRELIDEPLLRHLLDRYVDLEAMRKRIADRADSALAETRRAVADRAAEVAKLERAMDATERAWDADDIDARQYAKREARLTDEIAGARAALDQAQRAAESAGNSPSGGDPEQELLDHLAAMKAAVADGLENAPNLNVLRNVLAELFERVELVPDVDGEGFLLLPTLRLGRLGDGRWDFEGAGRRELPLPAAPLVAKP
jgi:site-specific DNA recombinase